MQCILITHKTSLNISRKFFLLCYQVGSAYGGSLTLTGLQQYTRYEVVVKAFNNRGDGPPSPPAIATTLEDGKKI